MTKEVKQIKSTNNQAGRTALMFSMAVIISAMASFASGFFIGKAQSRSDSQQNQSEMNRPPQMQGEMAPPDNTSNSNSSEKPNKTPSNNSSRNSKTEESSNSNQN
ncbi:MAG: hypothetical protein Q4A27_01220 [bacterium]|nr:hypothetical protein [bacterium]